MPQETFIFKTDSWVLVLGLLILMLAFIYIGRKVGLRRAELHKSEGSTGMAMSALFGLLAFLLAFTFGMSGSRFDARRKIIVDEANAIGTAALRTDLYDEESRIAFRKDFQQYLEARISYYELGTNLPEVKKAKARSDEYGKKIWDRAAQLSKNPERHAATILMIPAINEMLDISTTRLIGELSRVPDSIVIMLFALSLTVAFYLGYTSAAKGTVDWLVAVGFCTLTAVVIFITLDLDRPRRGLIQLNTSHQAMTDLRSMFDETK